MQFRRCPRQRQW